MLVLCHLFIGAVLGVAMYQRMNKRWIVPLVAFGAILPDLVDKPLGHLLLSSTLDSGRIYGHTLLFLAALLIAGVVMWRMKRTYILAIIGLGVGTHLLLDGMWNMPVSLFWPFLGPFEQFHYPDYFAASILTEVTSPSEWAFGILLVMIFATLYKDELGNIGTWVEKNMSPLWKPMLAILIVIGIVSLVTGLMTIFAIFEDGQNLIIVGVSAMIGGAYLLRTEMPRSLGAMRPVENS